MKLLDTTVSTCTYLGSATKACGCATLPGKSYCAEHYALVYQVGTARAKRKKDIRVAAQVWNIQDTFNEAVAELEAEGYDFGEERWDVPELDLD
jgi:hypothetical protein